MRAFHIGTVEVWCVRWRDREKQTDMLCMLASQPKGCAPAERDSMRTRCRHYVILPCGVDLTEPTCPDCRRLLGLPA